MSVADRLGLQDLEGPLMGEARVAWRRWCAEDPAFGVVGELDELSDWTRHAPRSAKDDVLARLATLTATEQDAVTVLAWLLVPGGTRIAVEFRDLHPDIDGMVAGQLWIEANRAHELTGDGVPRAILRRTRSAVMVDLGVGDAGRRCDRLWAESVRVDRFEDTALASRSIEIPEDALWMKIEIFIDAITDGAVEVFDAWLLEELASVACQIDAPARRGRCGLTAPEVVDAVAGYANLSARALCTRATKALDRVVGYLRVREDPLQFAAWKASRPLASLFAGEQMDLVITEDLDPLWVKARDHAAVQESVGMKYRTDEPA